MIEVGEYIRLARNQGIRKIEEIDEEVYLLDDEIANEWGNIVDYLYIENAKNEIVKHSKNIIDLLEEGDYVNGERVTAIYDEYKNDGHIKFETNYEGRYRDYIDEDIKSIVTKEQYKSVEYIVKEE